MKTDTDTIAMTAPETAAPKPAFRWKWLLYLAIGIALALAAKFFHVQDLLKQALDWVGRLGPWGAVAFIAIYVVATMLFVPGSVLTMGAGALFGVVHGSICVSIGSTLGATAAFLVGRYLARNAVPARLKATPVLLRLTKRSRARVGRLSG
jgi:uncharacterized membrane protein YdjX (TVP38/TMEM64 family)